MANSPKLKPAWSSKLVVELMRGLPRTIRRHRGTVWHLGLRWTHDVSIRDNNSTNRGMINQVKRLLRVETMEMYQDRLRREAIRKAPRPPITVTHIPPPQPPPPPPSPRPNARPHVPKKILTALKKKAAAEAAAAAFHARTRSAAAQQSSS